MNAMIQYIWFNFVRLDFNSIFTRW